MRCDANFILSAQKHREHTAKDLLNQERCEIFGRFFIAMLTQAAMQRAAIPVEKRVPTYVYIDEAEDYLDEHCELLFNQARKYMLGLTVAHQNLGQLGEKLKQSIMASTSIKLAGGVSAKDATAFSHEMRCDANFILSAQKHREHTEFACWIKHRTPHAIKIRVPLGSVERLPVISDADYDVLIARNRERYSTTLSELERLAKIKPPAPPAAPCRPEDVITGDRAERVIEADDMHPPPPPPDTGAPDTADLQARLQSAARKRLKSMADEPPPMGRGGKEHKYIQNIVSQYGQDHGWRAVIEQEILDGTGRVDVSLTRDEFSIACEISITTTGEQERANVEKCLVAGYDEVLVISPDPKHVKKIKTYVTKHLETAYRDRVRFLKPEEYLARLEEIEAQLKTREETVRGWKVTTTHKRVDRRQQEARLEELRKVIARGLTRQKDRPQLPE